MSNEKVKITTTAPGCRPGSKIFVFGEVKFDENGEAEITKEQADQIRGASRITFSDTPEEESVENDVEVGEATEEVADQGPALETANMGMDFGAPEGLDKIGDSENKEGAEASNEEGEVSNENDNATPEAPVENGNDDNNSSSPTAEELSSLTKNQLKDICKEANLPAAEYKNLNREDLEKYVIDKVAE